MANAKEIEKRKVVLRARGVPEKFVDNIARRKNGGELLVIGLTAWAVLMALIIFPIMYEHHIISVLAPYLYPYASSSLLFRGGNGVGATLSFIGLFGFLLIGVLWIFRQRKKPVRPFPAYNATAASLRAIGQSEKLEMITPNPAYAGIDHLPDDTAFLTYIRPDAKKDRIWPWLFAPCIILLSISSHLLSASDTTTVDLDSVTNRYLQQKTIYRFKDAKFVYVVCYDNPGSRPDFDYRVAFQHATVSLWQNADSVHGLYQDGVIERIDRIDQQLKTLGIPIHHMPMVDSIGIDGEECVAHAVRLWHLKSPETLRHLVFG